MQKSKPDLGGRAGGTRLGVPKKQDPRALDAVAGVDCEAVFALGEHVPSLSWALYHVADAKCFGNSVTVRWSHAGSASSFAYCDEMV